MPAGVAPAEGRGHPGGVALLAETLKVRREELRLGQAELAARLGVSQQTVSRWEQGLALPRPARVTDLARQLDLPVDRVHRLAGYLPEAERSDVDVPWHAVYERMSELTSPELALLLDRAWEELRSRMGLERVAGAPRPGELRREQARGDTPVADSG